LQFSVCSLPQFLPERIFFVQWNLLLGSAVCMAKDTLHRFLNSLHPNWSRRLLLLRSRMIGCQIGPLTGATAMKVVIVDDKLRRHNRSKRVELLSRVFSHIGKRYLPGVQDAYLGVVRRPYFSPVSFSLLGSGKELHRYVPSPLWNDSSKNCRRFIRPDCFFRGKYKPFIVNYQLYEHTSVCAKVELFIYQRDAKGNLRLHPGFGVTNSTL